MGSELPEKIEDLRRCRNASDSWFECEWEEKLMEVSARLDIYRQAKRLEDFNVRHRADAFEYLLDLCANYKRMFG